MAAAAAWDALAAELSTVAQGYGSILSELTAEGWLGPAALSMARTAAPYVSWLHTTAAQAEQTAAQAMAAAAAYELAFAMTVPPPVIAANRSLLMALIATNFFGQNAPAIAATETHYAEMWLQDATAMYGYAGASAAASQLSPFSEPPHTSNPGGLAAQSVAVAQAAGNASPTQPTSLLHTLSMAPATLQQLAAPSAPTAPTSSPTLLDILERVPNEVNTVLSFTNAATSGRGISILNARLAFQAAQEANTAPALGERLVSTGSVRFGGSVPSAVSAGMGRATLIGSLSAPPNWATAAPEIRPMALTLPTPGTATPAVTADLPPVPGSAFSQSVLGTLSRQGYDAPRAKSKPLIVRSPAAG
ncbi:PPE family protein [Mycobacterium sp. pUA109]|uniref:PPE family protein n=1 Tax=Mycobacterium sp. pUA109 TaxID=3238982 RepID=UPI00351BBC11